VFALIVIFILHFIGDFIFQPYWMKIKKSRQSSIMLMHILLYTSVLTVGLSIFYSNTLAISYALLNGVIHFLVDYASSRIISNSSRELIVREGSEPLYERVDMHVPILFLGVDQLLHHVSLIVTWYLIF